jgi:hypothetical protein
MTERYILEALQKAVIAAVAASTRPTLPVKYVGRTFEPSNTPWLEVIYIPNNVENEFWDTSRTYQGILRLLLHWPVDDVGAYTPVALLESIASYFTKGRKLADAGSNVRVKINDNPNFLGPVEQPPETLYPLSIRYQFFSA